METPADSYPNPPQPGPIRRRPFLRFDGPIRVSYILVGVTVLIYLLQLLSQWLWGFDVPVVLGVKANELIVKGQWWRLVTPIFLHGSPFHIFLNMYALLILGPGLERYYGRLRFLTLYLLAGFAGNATSFFFSPHDSLGSSTAIFGLIGAQAIFIYQNRQLFGGQAMRALFNVLFVALINFIIGLLPMIDNWGHLGGFLGGGLFAWIAGPDLSANYLAALTGRRPPQLTLLGGAAVLLLFGALTAWGIARYAG